MAKVTVSNVWKFFGDLPIVKNLSLEAEDGEFLVLVGASGCGKSTTLRMLAGLETPTYGSIHIGDDDVTLVSPGDRDIAMVFQSYALYPHMSVYKNLAFGPRSRREPRSEVHDRVLAVAETLGLTDYLDRTPSRLSGGQRQRVALGRVMIRSPRLSLLDEPLSNLDAAMRVQMRTELVRLQKELNVTSVYVTHDQVEAMSMGDRIAVLDRGLLLADRHARPVIRPAGDRVRCDIHRLTEDERRRRNTRRRERRCETCNASRRRSRSTKATANSGSTQEAPRFEWASARTTSSGPTRRPRVAPSTIRGRHRDGRAHWRRGVRSGSSGRDRR